MAYVCCPQGWNKGYPFNTGDLIISMNVLYNYLEANSRVPWEDLRYLQLQNNENKGTPFLTTIYLLFALIIIHE